MEAALGILVAFLAVLCVGYCIVKPRYAVVPVLMLFPAEQILMGYLPDFRWKYGWVTNLAVGLIALFGVAYNFFRERDAFRGMKNPVFISLMGLYAYILVSILWSPSQESAEYFIAKSWAYFFLCCIVAPLLVKSVDDLARIAMPLIVSGAVIMALMLINPRARFVDDRFTIDLGYVIGMGTLRSNPLAIADAGGILAIIAALYKPARNNPAAMLLKASGVLLGLTLALLSGSRGQVVASVAVLAVTLPFANGIRSAVRAVGSLLVVGFVVGFLYYAFKTFVVAAAQGRWDTHGSSESLNQRLDMVLTALGAYAANPAYWFTGLGAAAFNEYYLYRAPDNPHWYPHNIVVEAVTEYGLPGLVLLGIILYHTMKSVVQLYRLNAEDKTRRSIVVAFGGIALFQFIISLKQGALLGIPPLFMFCVIIGRVARNEMQAAYAAEALAAEENPQDPLPDAEQADDGAWRPAADVA